MLTWSWEHTMYGKDNPANFLKQYFNQRQWKHQIRSPTMLSKVVQCLSLWENRHIYCTVSLAIHNPHVLEFRGILCHWQQQIFGLQKEGTCYRPSCPSPLLLFRIHHWSWWLNRIYRISFVDFLVTFPSELCKPFGQGMNRVCIISWRKNYDTTVFKKNKTTSAIFSPIHSIVKSTWLRHLLLNSQVILSFLYCSNCLLILSLNISVLCIFCNVF